MGVPSIFGSDSSRTSSSKNGSSIDPLDISFISEP